MTEAKFILADIGGYTSFLSDVGLKHGREITEDLLNRLVRSAKGRWQVGNIMGDCIFFYGDRHEPAADTFGGIRSLYEEFREGVLDIANGSTCACGACNRTEDLTLKFVAHAGEYGVQKIGGRRELIGPEIVRASRLLKNSVPVEEYALLTAPVGDVAGAGGLTAEAGQDTYDDIGTVEYTYVDLGPVCQAYEANRAFYIAPDKASLAVETEIAAPADVVWDAMRDLNKRAVWQVTISKMSHLQGMENGVGEIHSCLHGGQKIVHATIAIDDDGLRKTERVWLSPPLMRDSYITMRATPVSEDRTLAALYATFKPAIPVISHIARPVFIRIMRGMIRKDLDGLKLLCETGHVPGREPAMLESGG